MGCLQAWHQVFSLLSAFSPRLTVLTHGMSIWIASLGWFVTIQYFALVVPNALFKRECEIWRERGVQFKEVGIVLHLPAFLIAVLDLLLAKNVTVLRGALSIPRSLILVVIYVVMYLAVISVNYTKTGLWPYGFMKSFGTNPRKWAAFLTTQVITMLVFFFSNVLIVYAKAYLG